MEKKEIKRKAYGLFESGFHCAEVVSKTVLEIFSEEPRRSAVQCASGFGGGIAGTTEELCGAFTGGVISLGALLGRKDAGDDLKDCGQLTKAFRSRFSDKFGSINCATLLKGFRDRKNHLGCVELTADAAVMLVDILKQHEDKTHRNVGTTSNQFREKVPVGCCPFTGCSC